MAMMKELMGCFTRSKRGEEKGDGAGESGGRKEGTRDRRLSHSTHDEKSAMTVILSMLPGG